MERKKSPSAFQEQYRTMTKDEVIEQYKKDYEGFLGVLREIPNQKIDEKFLSGWGIEEVVGHIAVWNLETIRGIKTVLEGSIPWFFDEQKAIDRFNKEEVSKRKGIPTDQLLQDVQTTHSTLIEFLTDLSGKHFHQGFGKKWRKQIVTPALVCYYRHYFAHTLDILEWMQKSEGEI